MKRLFLITSLLTLSVITHGQNMSHKVKIALLGTMHFTPSKQDAYKNEEVSWDERKQKELNEVIERIVLYNPDQICIERPLEKQTQIDSLYNAYLDGRYKLKENEIDLIGYQTAKKLNLKRLTCINYLGEFNAEPVMAYARQNNQERNLDELDRYAKKFVGEVNEKQKNQSLRDFFIYLNSPAALNKNLALYSQHWVKVGKDVGTDLVSDWYDTNLHIYTNIIRQIKETDDTIFVLFGQGHIPILKHLFESNPDFEVVEVKDILK